MNESGTNLYNEICRTRLTQPAIIVDDRVWTYEDFLGLIEQFAVELKTRGVSKSERIGLRNLSGSELLVAYYGCFKVGAVPVPIPFADVERIDGAKDAAKIKIVIDTLPTHTPVDSDESDVSPITPEAMVIFTSGTTSSKLKGVRLSHVGVSGTCAFMNQKMGVTTDIRECVFAPIDHAYGFGRCHAVLSIGGVLSLPESLGRLTSLFDIVANNNCNALSAPPSILASVLRAADEELKAIGDQILWLQTGAMRFDPFFREGLMARLPNARIFLHYGLSEAMRVTFFELNAHKDKIHTEGPPADGVELAILDEDHQPLANEQEGIVAIRGRNLCLGYLDQELWQTCLHEGWFVTSDRGRIDNDGFLVFCGRNDDTINSNGVLVNPDEIESKIQKHLSNTVMSVVGVPDPMGIKDSIIVLCIEGESSLSLGELAKKMSGTDNHLVPQKIVSLTELPRTRTSKVNRVALRKQVIDALSA